MSNFKGYQYQPLGDEVAAEKGTPVVVQVKTVKSRKTCSKIAAIIGTIILGIAAVALLGSTVYPSKWPFSCIPLHRQQQQQQEQEQQKTLDTLSHGLDLLVPQPGSAPFRTDNVKTYNFTLKRVNQTIDGIWRNAILVNGEFPGPLIEAEYGDTIIVTVNNEIEGPMEGTAMHWHGMLQTGTPWADGVSGVTQCPIAPGHSQTYEFVAEQVGTSWWHAHFTAQYAAGIFGPMVIHGPKHVDYDIDLGPLMLFDFFYRYYRDVLMEVMVPRPMPAAPPSDHNLMNGYGDIRCDDDDRGPTPCPETSKVYKLGFTPGKTHRLRLINAGAEGMQRFSIDGYKMKVIAVDFVAIKPYEAEVVTIHVGQRADVLIEVPEDAHDPVWMRSYISDICSFTNQHSSYGVAYFNEETKDDMPTTSGVKIVEEECGAESIEKMEPIIKIPAAKDPITHVVDIGTKANATGQWIWSMNGYTVEGDLEHPQLLQLNNKDYKFRDQFNVYDMGDNKTIRVVLNNPIDFPHPMHLHGHNFRVISDGYGEWDGTVTNPENPARRDTQMIRSNGYVVIEFDAERPGIWPFHCHIGPHLSAGLGVSYITKSSELHSMKIPHQWEEGCKAWREIHEKTPKQIDSGLSIDQLDTTG